jgi:hypothetical protein
MCRSSKGGMLSGATEWVSGWATGTPNAARLTDGVVGPHGVELRHLQRGHKWRFLRVCCSSSQHLCSNGCA